MRITARAAYACSAILELALHYGKAKVQAREIAERTEIPMLFLAQILVQLRHSGLVPSLRGVAGGYLLARDPQAITVLDVVEAVEGKLEPFEKRNLDPVLEELWSGIQGQITESLGAVTFESLVVKKLRARQIPDFQI